MYEFIPKVRDYSYRIEKILSEKSSEIRKVFFFVRTFWITKDPDTRDEGLDSVFDCVQRT